ncbi:MAG: acyl-CoA thioesterase [Aureispira sp.]
MRNSKRELTLRFLAEPTDVNFGGKVHGGMVMKWIDQAGYACARHWSGGYCVTVYVGGIQFLKPIHIGNLVEIQAKVIYTGRTSMHISIDVLAHDPKEEEKIKTTHCVIIFVAVDPDGNPDPIPTWVPETKEEKQQELYAKRLMKLRAHIQQEMDNQNN